MSVNTQKLNPVALLKEAGLAALVAGALAIPFAGFKSFTANGVLAVETRFDWVVIAAVIVFFGRILITIGQKHFLPNRFKCGRVWCKLYR